MGCELSVLQTRSIFSGVGRKVSLYQRNKVALVIWLPVLRERRLVLNRRSVNLLSSHGLMYNNHYPKDGSFKPGPTQTWIIYDSDNGGINTEPDAADSHGAAGSNVAYCDSHAAWVRRSEWRRQWNITRDDNASSTTLPDN